MADTFNKHKRSEIMRCVRSNRNKSTELRLIDIFKDLGIKGWRRNYTVKGKPDFVFLRKKIAVFTDGCFWHGHGCRNIEPKDNKDYWEKKLATNKARDKAINRHLRAIGWKIIRIWECELIKKNRNRVIRKLNKTLVLEMINI
jgi:DNA mismatch endonuclease (patch repair protein)